MGTFTHPFEFGVFPSHAIFYDRLWMTFGHPLTIGLTAIYVRVLYTLGGHSLCPPLGFQSVIHSDSA